MARRDPVAGAVVFYRLTAHDVSRVNIGREAFPPRQGNMVAVGEDVPFLITRVWAARVVNGQAFLDGNDSIWVTSVGEGVNPGQWRFG